MTRLFQLFILVTCVSLLSTAHANWRRNDPSWVREQIIEKKQCPGCILQNANLSGANLSEAEFIGSNLMNATWINGKKCTDRRCSNLR